MVDFNDAVERRKVNLSREYVGEALAQRALSSEQADAARQRTVEMERLRLIGLEAVRLLVERAIEPSPVFQYVPIGKKMEPFHSTGGAGVKEVDDYDWIQQGVGWSIYRHIHVGRGGTSRKKVALHEDGRLFDQHLPNTGPSHLPRGHRDGSGRGIDVDRWYDDPAEVEPVLMSDAFMNGLTHVANRWRTYGIDTQDVYFD